MRRPKGHGSAPRLGKDGRWRAYLTAEGPDGKTRRQYVYAETASACADKLHDLISKRNDGTLPSGPNVTFGQWLDHYLDDIAAARVRRNTLRSYRGPVRVWVKGTRLADKRLDQVTAEDLDALYTRMRKAGRSGATILNLHRVLAHALKFAVRRGRIAVSPATRLDPPRKKQFDAAVIDVDDARRLVQKAATADGGVRWMLALALGLRQGERMALGWDCVDLEAGTLEVKRSAFQFAWEHGCPESDKACRVKPGHRCPKRAGGGMIFGDPKSDAGHRSLALPDQLLDVLRVHREEQLEERSAAWAPFKDSNGVVVDLVFCGPDGTPMHPSTDHDQWRRFLKDAGVEPVRLHDARHTAATVLLILGVDPRVVMDIMGWSELSMLKRYQHVVDSLKRSAADAVGGALWGPVVVPPPPEDPSVVSLDGFRARRIGGHAGGQNKGAGPGA